MRVLFILTIIICNSSLYAKDFEKVSLQLKWFSSYQFAGYYMANEKGFYKEVGLDVNIIERDPTKNNIDQVINNEAEYGVADSALLLYRAKGKPVKILASIFQHSPLVFISRKESGIISPYEMKGKVLSFQKGLDDAPLLSMLQIANINKKDFQYDSLDFTSQELIDGKVDVMSAYLSDQPYFFKEKGIDINIINPLNYGIDFYGDNLFTTETEIKNHPKRVKAFTEASIKGWKYALENIDETIEILKSKYHAKATKAHLEYEAYQTIELILPDIIEIGYTSINRFYIIAEFYLRTKEMNQIAIENAIEELIYNSQEENIWVEYFYIVLLLLIVFLIITIALLRISSKLNITVKDNINAIHEKDRMIDKYVLISETDLDGIITFVSEAFCKTSQYPKEKLMGNTHKILRDLNIPSSFYKELWITLKSGKSWCGEIKNKKKDGSYYWTKTYIEPKYNQKNQCIGYRGISQNITESKLMEEISITDALTNIHNRRHFDTILPLMINSTKRTENLLCFMIMDIDYFKQYNDTYGHQEGDNVLTKVALTIKESLQRSNDYCFRLGGEEFAVLCNVTSESDAKVLAETIRSEIENLNIQHSRNLASNFITISIGLICLDVKTIDNKTDIYNLADKLLYDAKKRVGIESQLNKSIM